MALRPQCRMLNRSGEDVLYTDAQRCLWLDLVSNLIQRGGALFADRGHTGFRVVVTAVRLLTRSLGQRAHRALSASDLTDVCLRAALRIEVIEDVWRKHGLLDSEDHVQRDVDFMQFLVQRRLLWGPCFQQHIATRAVAKVVLQTLMVVEGAALLASTKHAERMVQTMAELAARRAPSPPSPPSSSSPPPPSPFLDVIQVADYLRLPPRSDRLLQPWPRGAAAAATTTEA